MLICFVFVFMALLEYALVNYTFFGKKARIAKKKLKESLRQREKDKIDEIRQNKRNTLSQCKYMYIYIPVSVCLTLLQGQPGKAVDKTENGIRRRAPDGREKKKIFFSKRAKSINMQFPAIKDVSIVDRVRNIILLFL